MIVKAAEVPRRDASVMTETASRCAIAHESSNGGYEMVSPALSSLSENGSNTGLVSAHGERESSPRAASVMTRIPCLRPLRGKGLSAFAIEPGPLDTPCWVWLGCLNSKGYAVRGTKDGRYLVHRRVYELVHGAIADGDQVHHRCTRAACVNPAHLDAFGQLEHAREHHGNATITQRTLVLLEGRTSMHVREVAAALGAREGSVGVALHRAARRGELVALGHHLFAVPAQEAAA